jgi:PEP-CTERM motif
MKKLLLIAAATLVCVGAYAQGKLSFQVSTDNLIYLTTDTTKFINGDATKTADWGGNGAAVALPGSSLYSGAGSTAGAIGGTWVVSLMGGTSAGSMTVQTTTILADSASFNFGGIASPIEMQFASLPAGTPAFFQVDVSNGAGYSGQSMLFQATPQLAVFSPIWQPTAPVSSGWTAGTQVLADYVTNLGPDSAGYFGGIAVAAAVPEPGTFALAGLGLAALLVLRRRS